MLDILIESLIAGTITCIIGIIIFNYTMNINNKNKEKPYGVDMAFFTTGVIMNIISYFININDYSDVSS